MINQKVNSMKIAKKYSFDYGMEIENIMVDINIFQEDGKSSSKTYKNYKLNNKSNISMLVVEKVFYYMK